MVLDKWFPLRHGASRDPLGATTRSSHRTMVVTWLPPRSGAGRGGRQRGQARQRREREREREKEREQAVGAYKAEGVGQGR